MVSGDGRARLFYLPPYSSILNPIEKLWALMKRKWRAYLVETNMEVLKKDDVEREINHILRLELDAETIKRLIHCNLYALQQSLLSHLI